MPLSSDNPGSGARSAHPALVARDVTKSFGKVEVLAGVDLAVEAGELLALLGPSGSGKTTLLRLMAGLEFPDRGQILLGERDVRTLSARERRIGFVFQHYALFQHMTVAENIAFGLNVLPAAARPPQAAIRKRAEELLRLIQLPGLGERYPSQLSGGQRQRVALARALAIEPRLLLLDEPFGALDAKVRKDLRRWLRDLHDATGHATVFVTHDQIEALELADRIAIMNHGTLEQVGTPDELHENPATAFVFGFIGESNRLDVDVKSGGVVHDGVLLGANRSGLADGRHQLLFRPHHASVTGRAGEGRLSGLVKSVRRTVQARRVTLAGDGASAPIELDVPESSSISPGETIFYSIDSYRLYPV